MDRVSFSSEFYIENRKALIKNLGMDSLVFIQSAPQMVRNSDIPHSWRPDSNFFYFTGIKFPDCSLLIVPQENGEVEEILFIPAINPEREKWNGKMLSKEEAKEISGIKKVQTSDTLIPTIFRMQKWREYMYCEVNEEFSYQALSPQHLLLEELGRRLPGLQLKKLTLLSTPLRLTKKLEEIQSIKSSLAVIETALRAVMKKLKPGMMEYQVEAEIVYHYLNNRCERQGFELIAAGGKNATVLHYIENKDQLNDGDLILIDTGGELNMYCGDITRVFPINGKFNNRQRQCYQTVLDVNQAFIKELKPGYTWKQLYEKAGEIIGEIYAKNGFIEDPKKHQEVSFHRIGHYLGLDVHDVGRLDVPMVPGTVITVEPGLYLPDEGIGIRIEDDVVITENGVEVLSDSIPREIDEIEEIMSKR